MARDVAIPLMESLTGAPAEELSPAISSKLPGILHTMMLRTASKLSGKAVAIGYCQDLPENARVWHVYPDGGIVMICHSLAERLGNKVHLKTPVRHIVTENGTVKGVETSRGFQPASAVISTAPVNVLPRLAPEAEALRHLSAFRFSSIVFVNLFLRGRGLLPNVAVWFPEKNYDFFRVQEPPISLPWTAPEGQTYFSVDIGTAVDSDLWKADDNALAKRCVEQLRDVVPDIKTRVLGARVLRTKIAYPVYMKSYEAARLRFRQTTGVKGLHSVGRNGEFAHILMEDVYHRTMKRTENVIGEIAAA
jgi:oxygen-dependent protoporphyrinogen oxidase